MILSLVFHHLGHLGKIQVLFGFLIEILDHLHHGIEQKHFISLLFLTLKKVETLGSYFNLILLFYNYNIIYEIAAQNCEADNREDSPLVLRTHPRALTLYQVAFFHYNIYIYIYIYEIKLSTIVERIKHTLIFFFIVN